MAVEANYTDGTVGAVNAAEKEQRDGVVASGGHDSWEVLVEATVCGLQNISFQLTLMCTKTGVGYCWLSVCGHLGRRNYTGSREGDCGHLKQLILMLSSFAARIQAAKSDS